MQPKTRIQPTGDKVVIRRLPPALTADEFLTILGPTWQPFGINIGSCHFETGKIPKDPSKPAKPSRAYLQVLRKESLYHLSETVRHATWRDAAGSCDHHSYHSVGQPVCERAIYRKLNPPDGSGPNGKKLDPKQGTIDQDPEFMQFLERLANPVVPGKNGGGPASRDGGEDAKDETDDGTGATSSAAKMPTTTPLIEAIRERKAAKVREAAAAAASKSKPGSTAAGRDKKRMKDGQDVRDKKPVEDEGKKRTDAPRETVKILTKRSAVESATIASRAVAAKLASTAALNKQNLLKQQSALENGKQVHHANPTAETASEVAESVVAPRSSKSRRACIAAAARVLQRDLGISPGSAHRRARRDVQKAEAELKAKRSASPAPETQAAPSPGESMSSTTKRAASLETGSVAAVAAPSVNKGRQGNTGPAQTRRGARPRDPPASGSKGKGAVKIIAAPTIPMILKKDKTSENTPLEEQQAGNNVGNAGRASTAILPPVPVVTAPRAATPATPGPSFSTTPVSTTPVSARAASKSTGTPGPAGNNKHGNNPGGNSGGPTIRSQHARRNANPHASILSATPNAAATKPGPKRAFIKNVYPSQGMTEQVLRTALKNFGDVSSIETDRRKGFAYVDFADSSGLRSAIAASPIQVSVAAGQTLAVNVVEFKEKLAGGGNAGNASGSIESRDRGGRMRKEREGGGASTRNDGNRNNMLSRVGTGVTTTASAPTIAPAAFPSTDATDNTNVAGGAITAGVRASPRPSRRSRRPPGPRGSAGGITNSNNHVAGTSNNLAENASAATTVPSSTAAAAPASGTTG